MKYVPVATASKQLIVSRISGVFSRPCNNRWALFSRPTRQGVLCGFCAASWKTRTRMVAVVSVVMVAAAVVVVGVVMKGVAVVVVAAVIVVVVVIDVRARLGQGILGSAPRRFGLLAPRLFVSSFLGLALAVFIF